MNNLEFAIKMELDGQKYYLEQANKNKGNNIEKVFLLLAEAEKEHAALLSKRLKEEDYILDATNLTEIKSVFHGLKDYKASDVRKTTQLDVYRLAVDIEEKSIELYKEMLDEASSDKDKELFNFLLEEENQHLLMFEELQKMLTRPEEWVESAEFGVREDY